MHQQFIEQSEIIWKKIKFIMERRKSIIIGIVGIVTVFLFLWGFNFINGRNIFKKEKVFYAVFEQLGGLDVGSPVTIKGYRVGQIKNVDFKDVLGTELIVTFNIEKDIKVPKGSVVEIYNSDLLGTKGLRVVAAESDEFHDLGDTINSIIVPGMLDEVAAQIEPLKAKTEELMGSIDSVVDILNKILIANEKSISSSLNSISIIAKNFEGLSASLNNLISDENGKLNIILSDIQTITTTLKDNEPELNNAITNFSNISDSLAAANIAQTVQQTNSVLATLDEITYKINEGEGSLGLLLNNDSLYNNLESLSKNLDELVKDIQENPKKYLNLSIIDMSKTSVN